jgi:hypothetical protein
VLEQGLHADAQGLVVAVGGGPDSGLAAHPGTADPGENLRRQIPRKQQQDDFTIFQLFPVNSSESQSESPLAKQPEIRRSPRLGA